MFKVNNKNTRTTSFAPFSGVFIVEFEQVNVTWVLIYFETFKYKGTKMRKDRFKVSSSHSLPIQEIEAATLSKAKQIFLRISQNSKENTCL